MCPAPHRANPIWRTFRRSDQARPSEELKERTPVAGPGERSQLRPAPNETSQVESLWRGEPSLRPAGSNLPKTQEISSQARSIKNRAQTDGTSAGPPLCTGSPIRVPRDGRACRKRPFQSCHPRRQWIAVKSTGIVSADGRSVGTPALGPCREPGGQLGASTPRLAPFSLSDGLPGSTGGCPSPTGALRRGDGKPLPSRESVGRDGNQEVCRQRFKFVRWSCRLPKWSTSAPSAQVER